MRYQHYRIVVPYDTAAVGGPAFVAPPSLTGGRAALLGGWLAVAVGLAAVRRAAVAAPLADLLLDALGRSLGVAMPPPTAPSLRTLQSPASKADAWLRGVLNGCFLLGAPVYAGWLFGERVAGGPTPGRRRIRRLGDMRNDTLPLAVPLAAHFAAAALRRLYVGGR